MKRPHFALPEIYDDSLSYYDVLRKLIKSMHVIADNLNKIPEQIANEAKARLLGDQNLQQNINAEASAREQDDNALQEKINTNKNDISELKSDITNKLPKSPINWEQWTTEEQAVARAKAGIVTDTPFELVGDVITEEAVQSIALTLSKPCRYISITLEIPTESVGKSRNVYFSATDKMSVNECFHRSQDAKTTETNRAIYKSTAEIIGGEIISYGGISASTNVPIDYMYRPIYGVLAGYGGLKADSFTKICVFTYGPAFPAGSKVKIYGC